MSRHVPSEFVKKLSAVQVQVDAARAQPRRKLEIGTEVAPGVRLVSTQVGGMPVVFSLWTVDADVAEVCGDGAYPAAAGLLAIDRTQLDDLSRGGAVVDLSYLTRSESVPGVYYALLDHLSRERLHKALGRIVPPAGAGKRA